MVNQLAPQYWCINGPELDVTASNCTHTQWTESCLQSELSWVWVCLTWYITGNFEDNLHR